MSRKKKSIAALGAAIAEREKNSTDQTSAVQQLVEAYLSTNNEAKRAKKIAEIKSRCGGLNELLSQNSELLTDRLHCHRPHHQVRERSENRGD